MGNINKQKVMINKATVRMTKILRTGHQTQATDETDWNFLEVLQVYGQKPKYWTNFKF